MSVWRADGQMLQKQPSHVQQPLQEVQQEEILLIFLVIDVTTDSNKI